MLGELYMNLNEASQENLKFLLEQLSERLGVANRALFDDEDYDLERYDHLKFLYDHVVQTGKLSPQETAAFVDELRSVRKGS